MIVGGSTRASRRTTRIPSFASWHDAVAYTEWLSRTTGNGYRLLSEAEWEYACRAGTTGPYWCGQPPDAHYRSYRAYGIDRRNGPRGTVPVDRFRPNRWGLYQMHGNVREWCSDPWRVEWSVDTGRTAEDYEWDLNQDDDRQRAVRGGAWHDFDFQLRAAYRTAHPADLAFDDVGFRVARALEDPAAFRQKVTSGDVRLQMSALDVAMAALPAGLGFASQWVTGSVVEASGHDLPSGDDNAIYAAVTDCVEQIEREIERLGITPGPSLDQQISRNVPTDYAMEFRIKLPDDAKESVRRLVLILPYVSVFRRSTSPGATCQLKVGETPVPWDEVTRSYKIPM